MYFNGNQVDHFLKELGLMHQVGSGIFIDGRKLADLMKIELPKTILAKPKLPKPDKVWSSLVLD